MPLIQTRGASSAQGYMSAAVAAPPPILDPVVGDYYKGGYYFGRIKIGSDVYRLVMAPKAQGEALLGMVEQASSATAPVPAMTVNDGLTNTLAFPNTSVYPASTWARALSINGYSDWYIPSRDEAELMYRNFKPTTAANFVGDRVNAVGESGTVANGVNTNSVPVGSAYTASVPPQTPLIQFRDGGSQALSLAGVFNALGITTINPAAWQRLMIILTTGQQTNTGNRDFKLCQRAVRRELYTG